MRMGEDHDEHRDGGVLPFEEGHGSLTDVAHQLAHQGVTGVGSDDLAPIEHCQNKGRLHRESGQARARSWGPRVTPTR